MINVGVLLLKSQHELIVSEQLVWLIGSCLILLVAKCLDDYNKHLRDLQSPILVSESVTFCSAFLILHFVRLHFITSYLVVHDIETIYSISLCFHIAFN